MSKQEKVIDLPIELPVTCPHCGHEYFWRVTVKSRPPDELYTVELPSGETVQCKIGGL